MEPGEDQGGHRWARRHVGKGRRASLHRLPQCWLPECAPTSIRLRPQRRPHHLQKRQRRDKQDRSWQTWLSPAQKSWQ